MCICMHVDLSEIELLKIEREKKIKVATGARKISFCICKVKTGLRPRVCV